MSAHVVSGRWRLGLSLALVTALMWGLLPIIMKGLLAELDSVTATWLRFAGAAALMWIWRFAGRRESLRIDHLLDRSTAPFLVLAAFFMCANYFTYAISLKYQTPSVTQTLMQIGPPAVFLGGAFLFKESVGRLQWLGLALLVAGLLLFFNAKLKVILSSMGDYTVGALITFLSALMWASYALSQKRLLSSMNSESVLLFLFSAGAIALLPFARLKAVAGLSPTGHFFLALAVLNTVTAFMCFAEALEHWEASRVGAIVALPPLFSVCGMLLVADFFPKHLPVERLNATSLAGAALVIAGSMMGALGKAGGRKDNAQEAMTPLE